jgi:ATP-dependent Clp protease ATP-binding subunit ClpA
LGFAASEASREVESWVLTEDLSGKIKRAGVEAARKRFTPEFINRLDKIVVFRPLGQSELRKILDIELHLLQQRVFDSVGPNYFVFTVADEAKQYLLEEGTDFKYGARHLKRAIERLVVQPLSSLIASDQLRNGDLVNIGYDPDVKQLTFLREAEGMAVQAMAEMAGVVAMPPLVAASSATAEAIRAGSARSSRRA